VDHLGSVRRVSTGGGALEKAYDFFPYGLPVKETVGQERLWFASYELEHQNTSDYTDDLYFLHARWYFPSMGRFLSPDPVRGDPAQPQSLNLYAYVRGNPLNAVDPDGRITLDAYQAAQAASEQEYYDASGERRAFFGTGDWLASRGMLWYAMPQEAPGGGGGAAAQANQAEDQARVDALVQAQDDVRARFRRVGNTTFCNRATVETARRLGANVTDMVDAQGRPLLANDIAANLAQSTNWRRVTPEEAQQLANRGVVVIAAQRRPDGHGHVATVRPEGVRGDQPQGARGPLINHVGWSVGIFRESAAFRRDFPVAYYAPAGVQP
jgi:RHS repeat-associated protein